MTTHGRELGAEQVQTQVPAGEGGPIPPGVEDRTDHLWMPGAYPLCEPCYEAALERQAGAA